MRKSYKLKDEFITKISDTRLYGVEIPIIGLTGGIGTGKSTASNHLASLGFNVINADQVVKKIYQRDDVIKFVHDNFPQCYMNDQINFKELRALFFTDSQVKEQIEQLIYSHLPRHFHDEVNSFDNPSCIIYDVPLLFEKKLDKKVDLTVCIYSSVEIQTKRILNRDNCRRVVVENILKSQMDIEEKRVLSDIVIPNTATLDQFLESLNRFVDEYFEE